MDLNKFLIDIGRIADALDRLADMKETGKIVMPTTVQTPADPDPGFGVDDNPPAETGLKCTLCGALATKQYYEDLFCYPCWSKKDACAKARQEPATTAPVKDDARRNFLKAALRALNIPFAAAARTTTLETLFAQAKPVVETPKSEETIVEIPVAVPMAEALEQIAAPVTKSDVQTALYQLSAAKGKEIALAAIQTGGGKAKLMDCDPASYPAIIAACKAAL